MLNFLRSLVPSLQGKEVYCQYCGTDITDQHGDLTNSGRIYCHGDKPGGTARCSIQAMFREIGDFGPMTFETLSPKEMQRAIRDGRLEHYALTIEGEVIKPKPLEITSG